MEKATSVMGFLGCALITLFICYAIKDVSTDKGACVKSHMSEPVTMFMPRPYPHFTTLPAEKVCDEWEFPKGRPTK